MAEQGSLQARLEQDTWKVLKHLASSVPEACVHFQDAVVYTREEDVDLAGPLFVGPGKEPWWKDVVDNCSIIPTNDLPSGIAAGTKFTTVCINPPLYLSYLVSECRRRGVVFKRQKVESITEAQELHHPSAIATDIIVNATGLGSKVLKGVEDSTLFPARGQTVLVANDPGYMMAVTAGRDDRKLGYCMTRAAGGGTILGGCFQTDNVESTPDFNLASQFMKTVVELCPSIVKPGQGVEALKIIRHGVGLRPMRRDGPRIEFDEKSSTVIHCYGHGSYGYQTSWASAEIVVKLIEGSERAQRPGIMSVL
jgi:glycine/D-amino acid oxidase-like deaminating enzyme